MFHRRSPRQGRRAATSWLKCLTSLLDRWGREIAAANYKATFSNFIDYSTWQRRADVHFVSRILSGKYFSLRKVLVVMCIHREEGEASNLLLNWLKHDRLCCAFIYFITFCTVVLCLNCVHNLRFNHQYDEDMKLQVWRRGEERCCRSEADSNKSDSHLSRASVCVLMFKQQRFPWFLNLMPFF